MLCETYPQEYKGGRVIVPEGTRKGLLKEGECSELWNRGSGIRDIAGQGHCISKAGNDGWHSFSSEHLGLAGHCGFDSE